MGGWRIAQGHSMGRMQQSRGGKKGRDPSTHQGPQTLRKESRAHVSMVAASPRVSRVWPEPAVRKPRTEIFH